MEFVYDLVLVLHFFGLASLLGGIMVQLSARGGRVVNLAMLHGALTQLVTGVALVGMGEAVDSLGKDVNQAKIGVKLVVVLIVTALCFAYRKRTSIADGVFFALFGLSAANVVIAVFWT
ncbi:hypothetical protein [Jiangella mangrovi]|uniref:Integral membrane protein n=1 Tax=Jiangella mangrovi TaxID=1524084 RepID=A0A7W9GQM8_9ACTN|nr:hypothetical protein [Jiangella mangrovi]MBB5788240.1 hypothetical protein [Jiangella mangrovi]